MTFYVGQKVVCVDDSDFLYPEDTIMNPRKGVVYTIRAVGPTWPWLGNGIGLLLNEVQNPPNLAYRLGEPSYRASRFRPFDERKTDIAIFTEILDRSNGNKPRVKEVEHQS